MISKPRVRTALLLALALVTAACGTLSVEDEKQLGREMQRQVRQEATLMRDRAVVNYIRQMGADLVAASRPTPFDVRFYVIEDESINAFAAPGGSVYVHTGLIQACNHADELMGVIAHEIGHVTARHTAQIYRTQRNTGLVARLTTIALMIITGNPYVGDAANLLTGLSGLAYLNKFGRDFEREADALGLEAVIKSGWNPEGMLRLFETLKKEGGSGGPQFLSSHPSSEERIRNTQDAITRLPEGAKGRTDDNGQLKLIQRRLELIIGSESESDPVDDDEH